MILWYSSLQPEIAERSEVVVWNKLTLWPLRETGNKYYLHLAPVKDWTSQLRGCLANAAVGAIFGNSVFEKRNHTCASDRSILVRCGSTLGNSNGWHYGMERTLWKCRRRMARDQMLCGVILPLGGALRLERPCNVNRFLASAVRSRLRLVEASTRKEREREEK